jgi:NitT/TauT family transport system substrate-binding protein
MTAPGEGMAHLPLYAARDRGFFLRHGLDVEMPLLAADRSAAAVASGEIHYVGGVGAASIAAAGAGLPLRAVWVSASAPPYTVFTRPEITSMEQLRGKRIGVASIGGSTGVGAKLVLKHYGLENEVAILQLGADELRLESLRSGAMEASPLTAPQSLEARRAGLNPLLDMATIVQMPLGGLSATLDKLSREPEQVRRLIRALTEAQQWIATNRAEVVPWIADTFNLERGTAEGTYDEALPSMQGKGLVTREGIDNVLQSLRDEGRFGPEVRYEDVADGRLAEAVARELGLLP